MRWRWPLVLILVATMLTFVSTLGFQFVYDDLPQIVENPRIQAWHYVPSYFSDHVWAQHPDVPHQYYRPLFLLQLRVLYWLFGVWVPGWHLVLVLSHLAAVIAVYSLVLQWKDHATALIAAGLFAVHPVHAEVVSWASAIAEPWMLVALLTSLVLALRPGKWNLLVATACYAVALMLKETAIVWPLIILLVAYCGLTDTIRRTLPFWGVTALYLAARFVALGSVTTPPNDPGHPGFAMLPTILTHYFLHLVWPVGLSEFYFLHLSWLYLLLLVPVLAALIWVALRDQYHRAAVLILLVPLLPVLNLKLMRAEFILQDRYLYLPSVGFGMLLAPLLVRVPKPALAVSFLLLCALCIRESQVWRDAEHLYGRALQLNPTYQRARDSLGRAYARQARYGEAIAILQPLVGEAQPSARQLQQSLMTLAYSYEHMGNLREAFRYYSAADELYPNHDIEQHLAELKAALQSQQLTSSPQR